MKLDHESIRFAEHLSLWSPLALKELCDALRGRFGLPEFQYDFENETERGLVLHEGVEYNVSRPYAEDTLQKWDDSVPAGCNIGIALSVSTDCAEPKGAAGGVSELASRIGQALADLLGQPVQHHRTWLGPGKNITRNRVFNPSSQDAH